jgi:hypothetical protein
MNEYDSQMARPNNKKRNTIIGVITALLVLLLCCCIVIVGIIVADPFGLGIMARLFGGADPTAAVMPADVDGYMSLNLLNVQSEKGAKIIEAFSPGIEDTTSQSTDDLIYDFNDFLLEELDLTLEDDILPWIGQFAGIGVTNIEYGRYGSVESADVIFSVEARDVKAADAFLAKISDRFADSMDVDVKEKEYNGVKYYEIDSDYEEQNFAFGRSGRMLIITSSAKAFKKAVDAPKSGSLAKDKNYSSMVKQLPAQRAVTFYLDSAILNDILENTSEIQDLTGGEGVNLDYWQGSVMSLAVVDAGIQVDVVTAVDTTKLSAAQKEMMAASGKQTETAKMFPEVTYAYFAGQRLDLTWSYFRELMTENYAAEDFDEALDMFEDEFDINPDKDLFPYLNGDWAFAVVPDADSIFAKQMEIEVGVTFLTGISDSAAVSKAIKNFNGAIESEYLIINEQKSGDLTINIYEDTWADYPMYALGINTKYLAFGTSQTAIESLFAGKSSLADSAHYRQVISALPKSSAVSFYVDVESTIDMLRSSLTGYELSDFEDIAPLLEPITFIVQGSSGLKNNMSRSTFIVFIPTN